jgi:hypothetical protein
MEELSSSFLFNNNNFFGGFQETVGGSYELKKK